ncbi:hypothetical protein C8J57DRAFT_1459355 [Mycena rebaudengoi]|nr:hypothetical protein C8J57DRAFT_1459355 [Mycena rebaudengoi]
MPPLKQTAAHTLALISSRSQFNFLCSGSLSHNPKEGKKAEELVQSVIICTGCPAAKRVRGKVEGMGWGTTEIEIPLDVVLEISARMNLQHSLRLLATCKNYQSLSSSKAFWLGALKRITDVHRRPLPCPSATDLSTIALDKLREMAIHAYTLMKNWLAENPTPVSARIVQTNFEIGQLHVIPGTHLMVILSGRDIVCWDVITETSLGSVMFPSPGYITIGSNPFELPGQSFFGVAYDFDLYIELAVICIDYSDSANVTIAKIHSYEWSIPGLSHHSYDVALDENQIGMIVTPKYPKDGSFSLALVFCNHHDKLIHCINTQLPTTRAHKNLPRCLIHAGQFYIAIQKMLAMDIHHNDVFAVTLGSLLPDVLGLTPTRRVYFWPVIDTGAGLSLGPTCSYEHDSQIIDMHASASGRSAVIWYRSGNQNPLGLIHPVIVPIPAKVKSLWGNCGTQEKLRILINIPLAKMLLFESPARSVRVVSTRFDL